MEIKSFLRFAVKVIAVVAAVRLVMGFLPIPDNVRKFLP